MTDIPISTEQGFATVTDRGDGYLVKVYAHNPLHELRPFLVASEFCASEDDARLWAVQHLEKLQAQSRLRR